MVSVEYRWVYSKNLIDTWINVSLHKNFTLFYHLDYCSAKTLRSWGRSEFCEVWVQWFCECVGSIFLHLWRNIWKLLMVFLAVNSSHHLIPDISQDQRYLSYLIYKHFLVFLSFVDAGFLNMDFHLSISWSAIQNFSDGLWSIVFWY